MLFPLLRGPCRGIRTPRSVCTGQHAAIVATVHIAKGVDEMAISGQVPQRSSGQSSRCERPIPTVLCVQSCLTGVVCGSWFVLFAAGLPTQSEQKTHPVIGRAATVAKIGRMTNPNVDLDLVGRVDLGVTERANCQAVLWTPPCRVQPPRRRSGCARRSRACSTSARCAPRRSAR